MDEREQDAVWVEGLRAGHVRVFDAVYAHFAPRVYAHLVNLTGRPALAEDLCQATWMRVARSSPGLEPGSRLAPWIFTIARNCWRSERRAAWLSGARLAEWTRQVLFDPQTVDTPHALLERDEAAQHVARAFARLPETAREALLLVVVQGLEPTDAAAVVGIAPEAFRQRLSRARAALAGDLAREER